VDFSISQKVVLAVEQRRIVHLLTNAVEELSIPPVAVLAVEQRLKMHLPIVVAMDEFVKSNSLSNYCVFYERNKILKANKL